MASRASFYVLSANFYILNAKLSRDAPSFC
jgi:hypothetical protein